MPQLFCDYFSEKVKKIRTELDINASPPSFGAYEGNRFSEFHPVSEKDIRDLIVQSSTKSCVLDPLPTQIVKEHIDILVPVITEMTYCQKVLHKLKKKCEKKTAWIHFLFCM